MWSTTPVLDCNDSGVLFAAKTYHDTLNIPGNIAHITPYRGNKVSDTSCDIAYQHYNKDNPGQIFGTDARRFHFQFDTAAGVWKVVSMDPSQSGVTVDRTVPAVMPTLAPAVAAKASWGWLWFLIFVVIFAALAYMFYAGSNPSVSSS